MCNFIPLRLAGSGSSCGPGDRLSVLYPHSGDWGEVGAVKLVRVPVIHCWPLRGGGFVRVLPTHHECGYITLFGEILNGSLSKFVIDLSSNCWAFFLIVFI